MTKKQNILLKASIAIAVLFAIAPASNAMHIMEGYLQATFCIAWGVICLPFIVAGFYPLQNVPQYILYTHTLPVLVFPPDLTPDGFQSR